MRNYAASNTHLMHETLSKQGMRRAKQKNILGLGLYLLAALAAFVSVYIPFVCFLIVPAMYFIPEKIVQTNNSD